ncbi:glc operon protein GlcG [Stella humosa]|uniref:Glc operon protein GlcG n=1 Tax=Stella humosa TaxID=94 RepID=A0A3N1MER8_9PROT|nr:heme-binding protein [Stella humosa]ROP99665.1 glc operon protein GlcG [Stella humosa]BBK31110.1 hypothetical protein STHU_17440 [Stella humosa]
MLPSKKVLTLAAARIVMDAAEAEATRNGWRVSIAIVDDGGFPVLIQRLDGAAVATAATATGKAHTAAIFRRPTKAMEDTVNNGRFAFLNAPDVVPLEGGLPITVDGDVVGAIGVSGVKSSQDAEIGQAGIDALLAG